MCVEKKRKNETENIKTTKLFVLSCFGIVRLNWEKKKIVFLWIRSNCHRTKHSLYRLTVLEQLNSSRTKCFGFVWHADEWLRHRNVTRAHKDICINAGCVIHCAIYAIYVHVTGDGSRVTRFGCFLIHPHDGACMSATHASGAIFEKKKSKWKRNKIKNGKTKISTEWKRPTRIFWDTMNMNISTGFFGFSNKTIERAKGWISFSLFCFWTEKCFVFIAAISKKWQQTTERQTVDRNMKCILAVPKCGTATKASDREKNSLKKMKIL